jgi:hypothetical protein
VTARPGPVDGVAEAGDMEKHALAGRYALGERVGVGGMADVFTARDIRLERNVAVKLFRPGTADGIQRGSAEAKMLARLEHPGLVRVLDMDNGENSGDAAYLVMELVDGPDLNELLRTGGSMGCEAVRLMGLDLARTLQYIHSRGIVHRDIKPSNILTRDVDPHSGLFRYLLTDFGIARFFDGGRMTATGQVIGSAAYFSPEQARGDGVGQSSDIYSLGLVMIEALTGERAFPGTGIESALARLHRSPSIPHAAGPALSDLLMSMTLDDPHARPDAEGVVRALTVMGPQHVDSGAADSAHATDTARLDATPAPTRIIGRSGVGVDAAESDGAESDGAESGGAESGGAESAGAVAQVGAVAPPAEIVDLERTGGPAERRWVAAERVGVMTGTPSWSDEQAGTGRGADDERARYVPDADGPPQSTSRPARRRRSAGLRWLVVVLGILLVAAGLWVFSTLAGSSSPPAVEPLPAVSGEPGEKLQELYESVQR